MTTTLVFVFRFKERLKTKYLRELRQKQQLSGSLDSRKWCFLSPGLDDFRDGYPAVHKELFTRVRVDPPLQSLGRRITLVQWNSHRRDWVKIKCVTKQNPQSQAQREFIDAVEHKLKPYPLALCPHLESGMITEVITFNSSRILFSFFLPHVNTFQIMLKWLLVFLTTYKTSLLTDKYYWSWPHFEKWHISDK